MSSQTRFPSKHARDLDKILRSLGYVLERKDGDHFVYSHPRHPLYVAPGTPSDRRAWENAMAGLRKRHPSLRTSKASPEVRRQRRERARRRQRPARSAPSFKPVVVREPEPVRVVPNPGSPDAVRSGCVCPVFANNHGAGLTDRPGVFEVVTGCELHRDF